MRIDTGGRDPSVSQYLVRGTIFLAVCAVVLVLLMMRYEGKFDSRTVVTAELTDVGDGLVSGADVRYNGFIVGAVDSIDLVAGDSDGVQPKGDVQQKNVKLELLPDQAGNIPANATVRTVPSNLFGVNSVELVAPQNPITTTLSSGDVLQADRTAATIRLQDAQNELRNLLRAVPPEDLGMVLGTIADSLEGGGATFSLFVSELENYWKQINAHFPDGAPSGFANFNAAVQGLAKSAPQLVDELGKSVVPAMTIADQQRELTALLSSGQGIVDEVQTLFARNKDGGKRLVSDLNTVLGATMYEPDAMPQALRELRVLADRVLGVFTGTNRHVQLNIGVNFGAYQRYSRQNCPVYNGGKYGQLRGPGCVGAGTGTGPTSSGPLRVYPSEGIQRRTVNATVDTKQNKQTLKQALGREPTAADQLMLGPLVTATTPTSEAK